MPTLNFGPCARRSTALEPIEDPTLPEEELKELLSFIDVLSHWTGGNQITLDFLKACSSRWLPGDTISILEVGCLKGDLARSMVDWARAKKFDVRVLAIEHDQRFIHLAKAESLGYPEITFDVRTFTDKLFLQGQQFDYVISAQAVHRESGTVVRAMLKKINFLAKRGVLVSDWMRDVRALLWVSAFSWITRNEAIRRGAQLAIKKGFTVDEMKKMGDEAGLRFATVQRNFGYRFSLLGERALVSSPKLVPIAGLAT